MADEESKHDFEKEIVKVQKLIKDLVKSKLRDIVDATDCDEIDDNGECSTSEQFALDAEDVFQSLPEDMQYSFIMQDKEALAEILVSMPSDEAEKHMKKCVESGLWIPDSDDGCSQASKN